MKVCVVGLWHLGCVTAASLADGGHIVTGLDFDGPVVHGLRAAKAPLFEPGLDQLLAAGLNNGRLTFSGDPRVVSGQDVVWIAYDTPVDDRDRADVDCVIRQVEKLFPHLTDETLVLVSSQLPVGTTARFEQTYRATTTAVAPSFSSVNTGVTFGYSPENLRLGKALQAFRQPDRVVVGVRNERDRDLVRTLLAPFTNRIEWMSVESAEMTKHALNAFLAVSIAFANEMAALCEAVEANAHEVARGLKSESRIGPGAYLSPGAAFAGGTLARDLVFLNELGEGRQRSTALVRAAFESNESHKLWAERRLHERLGSLEGLRIAVWGLTYKPGTDTLRRSSAVELCQRLHAQGAVVRGHDPTVRAQESELPPFLKIFPDAVSAAEGASAIVVATAWPEYKSISAAHLLAVTDRPFVFDANRYLMNTLGAHSQIKYVTVGGVG